METAVQKKQVSPVSPEFQKLISDWYAKDAERTHPMKLVYQDAEVEPNWNGSHFNVKCRNLELKGLTGSDLIKLAYPAIDAEARKLDAQPETKT